jgi:hypothetical protein
VKAASVAFLIGGLLMVGGELKRNSPTLAAGTSRPDMHLDDRLM